MFPPELYQMVLSHMEDACFWLDMSVGEKAGVLGKLALTCRYWAKQVRYIILADLCLNSRDGVRRMKSVLNSPENFQLDHPTKLMRVLVIDCRDTDHFWVYDALQTLSTYPHFRQNAAVELTLDTYSSLGATNRDKLPSTFYYLPKPMPLLFRPVMRLQLLSVRFNTAEDFLKLIGEFYNVGYLDLGDVTWNENSPVANLPLFPSSLREICLRESDRYGMGGLGALPWIIFAAASFADSRHRPYKTRQQEDLPWRLQHHPGEAIVLPPTEYRQPNHMIDVVRVFYDVCVSSILESDNKIEWEINRIPGSFASRSACTYATIYTHHSCSPIAGIVVLGLQKHTDVPMVAVVTPSIMFVLENKPAGAGDVDGRLYVTRISVNFLALNLSMDELILYNWASFFEALTCFEYLGSVELIVGSLPLCQQIFENHRPLWEGARAIWDNFGRQPCLMKYCVEGAGCQHVRGAEVSQTV